MRLLPPLHKDYSIKGVKPCVHDDSCYEFKNSLRSQNLVGTFHVDFE